VLKSSVNYDSLYLHGSYARGTQTESSDIDIIVLMSLPALIGQIGRIRKLSKSSNLWRRHVNVKFISLVALKRIRSNLRLITWEKDAILIDGRDVLPVSGGRPTPKDLLVGNFTLVANLLNSFRLRRSGSDLPPRALKKAGRFVLVTSKIHGTPPRMAEIAETLSQCATEGPTGQEKAFDALTELFKSTNFQFKQTPAETLVFVAQSWIRNRDLPIRTLFKRRPIGERLYTATEILVGSLGSSPTYKSMLPKAVGMLDDCVPNLASGDVFEMQSWIKNRVRHLSYIAIAPIGTLVLEFRGLRLILL